MSKAMLAVLAALSFTGCVQEDDQLSADTVNIGELSAKVQKDLTTARQATSNYHDFAVAAADGYVDSGLPCIEGQGFHFLKPALLGTNDVKLPQLLMYIPDDKGVLQLISLEWLQPITDETTKPFTLFGQTFHGPNTIEGVPFPFFSLHVWAWKDNSTGLFEDTNPQVHCR